MIPLINWLNLYITNSGFPHIAVFRHTTIVARNAPLDFIDFGQFCPTWSELPITFKIYHLWITLTPNHQNNIFYRFPNHKLLILIKLSIAVSVFYVNFWTKFVILWYFWSLVKQKNKNKVAKLISQFLLVLVIWGCRTWKKILFW